MLKKGKKEFVELMFKSKWLRSIFMKIKPNWHCYSIIPLYNYTSENKRFISMINQDSTFDYPKSADEKICYESWDYSQIEKRNCSPQYISFLEDATIKGDMDAVLIDDMFLSDKILFDRDGFEQHLPPRVFVNGDICLMLPKTLKRKSVPYAITLIKMWSCNYFHFVFEGLSRLGEIDKLDEYHNWPIVLDSCVRDDPRNLEIINILNVNHREIIWIDKDEEIFVKKLLVPPTLTLGIFDVEKSVTNGWGYMIDNKAGRYLRETVLSQIKSDVKQYNCVYVARGNNKRLINESQIIEYFSDNGFEIFYPDRIKTFSEEVECFSTANCIVSCAGGASTNFVFCKESVDIFCFLPFEFRCDSPNDVTKTVNIKVKMIDGNIIKNGGFLMNSTFSISIDKCREIVEYCQRQGYLTM